MTTEPEAMGSRAVAAGAALTGKVALVSGAASGIGRAIGLLFAEHGAAVAIVDRDRAGADAVARSIEQGGGRALALRADLTQVEDCVAAVQAVSSAWGRLDILVNSAGIIRRATVLETSEAEWDQTMAVNLKSVFLLSKQAIPHLSAAGGGSIVNIASGWGLVGGPRAAAYCSSKGAVVQLSKAMAIDHGPDRVRVNCVCPGDTDTPMLRAEAAQLGEPVERFLAAAAQRPLGRIGQPEEIARAALFLASDAASFITGAVLVVDGGGLA